MMIIRKETNKEILNKEGAFGAVLNNYNNCEYVRLRLEPDAVIEKHVQPFPVTFYVLSEEPSVFIDEEEHKVCEGDLIEVEANVMRGWKNNSGVTAEILAVKHLR